MLICNYFKGSTDKLTGFIYDTATKTFKKFVIKADKWSENGHCKPDVKIPGDIDYFFPTFASMEIRLERLKDLGFTENNSMLLDFGTFTL